MLMVFRLVRSFEEEMPLTMLLLLLPAFVISLLVIIQLLLPPGRCVRVEVVRKATNTLTRANVPRKIIAGRGCVWAQRGVL